MCQLLLRQEKIKNKMVVISNRMSYNEIIKDKGSIEYYLYLLVNNNKMNLETLYGDDEIMKQVYEDAKKLTSNFDEILFYNKEELYNQVSFEKGEENGKKSIVINMLKKGLDISLISEITGFSIEEINTIQKELT